MNSSPSPKFDDDSVMAIASLTADAVASRLEAVRERLPSLLPDRCLREIDGDDDETPKLELEERARERLVTCESALAALGQSSRSLCDQSDEMNRLHDHFVHRRHEHDGRVAGADRVGRRLQRLAWQTEGELCVLLGRLTLARMSGLRSVLLAQLDREFSVRTGRPIPFDVKLPVGSGSGGDPELELVPAEPKRKDSEGTEDGGEGGSGGAAPAAVVVVATVPPEPDSTGPGAGVDHDEEDDGLDFLDIDRKG